MKELLLLLSGIVNLNLESCHFNILPWPFFWKPTVTVDFAYQNLNSYMYVISEADNTRNILPPARLAQLVQHQTFKTD